MRMNRPTDVRRAIKRAWEAHERGEISDNALKARCTAGNTILACFESEGTNFKAEYYKRKLELLEKEVEGVKSLELQLVNPSFLVGSAKLNWIYDANDGKYYEENPLTGEYDIPYSGPMNESGEPAIPQTQQTEESP